MQSHLFHRLGVLFIGLLVILLDTPPAQAEGRCPPGYYPTGGGTAGWLGCAPMGPIEEEGAMDDEGSPNEGGYGNDLPPIHYDPAEWEAWGKAAQQAETERMKDPKYRELKTGFWDYADSGKPQQICTALFLTLRGGVMFMDWGGKDKGTFLAFFGGNIPKIQKIATATVSLTQSGETQTVQAFHAPLPWAPNVGMILFAVPSTEALLSSIEDSQDFDVKMAGQSMVWGSWHSGLKARDWMRACVGKRGAP